jgi:predicted nucleic acid-binding protein
LARVIGTLGIVLRAKTTGRVASAVSIVRALRDAGLYLDTELVRRALREIVGESWDE